MTQIDVENWKIVPEKLHYAIQMFKLLKLYADMNIFYFSSKKS